MAAEQNRLEGISVIVFDAYGTLFDVGSPVAKLSEKIGDNAGPLAKLWRQKQLEYTWLRSLMGVHADFWQVTRDALDWTLAELGIDDETLAEELMALYLRLKCFDDTLPALAELRGKGRRLAILSNGSPAMLDATVRNAGLDKTFEHVISVEDVGIYKPSRRVYRLVMQRFHLGDAPSVAFVSANPWDVQGAATFGFQSVRLSRNPGRDDNIPGKPTRVISSLLELVDLV